MITSASATPGMPRIIDFSVCSLARRNISLVLSGGSSQFISLTMLSKPSSKFLGRALE